MLYKLAELVYNGLDYFIAGIIGIFFSGCTWLVRRVLTNEKQIALLQNEIQERDKRRCEDREIMNEIKTDLKEVKRDILDIYKTKD